MHCKHHGSYGNDWACYYETDDGRPTRPCSFSEIPSTCPLPDEDTVEPMKYSRSMKNFCILASVILTVMVSELIFFCTPPLLIVTITIAVIFFSAIIILALEWRGKR
jgi:hypothetical protein